MTAALRLIANQSAYEPASAGIDRELLLLFAEHRAAVLNVARIEAEIEGKGRKLIAAKYPNEREFMRPTLARIRNEVGLR